MADQIVRPAALATERTSPVASEWMVVDNGATVARATVQKIVEAGRPTATQPEAEAGTDPMKAMTPLTTKQAIDAQVPNKINAAISALNLGSAAQAEVTDFATSAQGALADSAVQPGGLAVVATSGSYNDLSDKPTLSDETAAESRAWAIANLHPVAAPSYIRTAGYGAPGDSGEALYKKVLAEPAHAGKFSITLSDGVTVAWYEIAEEIIVPTQFGGTTPWYQKGDAGQQTAYSNALAAADTLSKRYSPIPAGVYSPPKITDFGCRPDYTTGMPLADATDNSGPLQDAMDYLVANGGRMEIPSAGFDYNFLLLDGIGIPSGSKDFELVGMGERVSRFAVQMPSPKAVFSMGTPSTPAQDMMFKGFEVWGDPVNATHGFDCYDSSRIKFEEVGVRALVRGIRLTRCYAPRILNSFFRDCSTRGLVLDENSGNSAVIRENGFFDCGTAGDALTGAISIDGGDNPLVIGNDIEGCNVDLIVANLKSLLFTANYCEGGDYHFNFVNGGVYGNTNFTITNNWFNQKDEITPFSNTKGLHFSGNQLRLTSFEIGNGVDVDIGSNELLTATLPGSSYINAPLNAGFANDTGVAGYRRGRDGIVRLRGYITKAGDGVAFTLPAGYRPSQLMWFMATGNTGTDIANISVGTNGQVTVYGGGGKASLSGISFPAVPA